METGLRRTVDAVLLLEARGQLAAVTVGHGISRDTTKTSIVVVQVLFGVRVVSIDTISTIRAIAVLESGNVVGGIGLLQLWHQCHYHRQRDSRGSWSA